MKRTLQILLLLALLGVAVIAAMIWVPVQRTAALPLDIPEQDITVARGEYLMRASDCIACHTAPGGKPFAGGRAIDSPLGTIWSTNITPDKETGIGHYTLAEFRAALYDGLNRHGRHLYPAMPYENYRVLSEADIRSLYRYFMEGVPAVHNAVPETKLAFPFNQRWGLRAWNWLALGEAGFHPPTDDERINRGAYLVRGPAHCAACHSPRTAFMAQKGRSEQDAAFLSGGDLNGWSVPSLHGPDSVSAHWSLQQMAHYLATGRNDSATAVGEMALVVGDSLQYLTPEDNLAIAAYLKHISGGDVTPQAAVTTSSGAGTPSPSETQTGMQPPAAPPTDTERLLASADPSMPLGARLYLDNCAGCHFVDGKGAPEIFPSLDGNLLVTAPSPNGLIHVILHGAQLPSTALRPARLRMQGYDWRLSDEEVAELATFVRQAWSNRAAAVSATEVTPLR